MLRDSVSSSVCNLSNNETNVCDDNPDANIEYVETDRQFKNSHLTFPLTPMPTSMCHPYGSICKTDKSQLAKLIEKKLGSTIHQQPSSFDVCLVDGS